MTEKQKIVLDLVKYITPRILIGEDVNSQRKYIRHAINIALLMIEEVEKQDAKEIKEPLHDPMYG